MKKCSILIMFLFLNVSAYAADGVDCFKRAKQEISRPDDAPDDSSSFYATLCESASSTAPVDCFNEAMPELVNTDHTLISLYGKLIGLCKKATSTSPVECLKKAKKDLMNSEDAPDFNIYLAIRICGQN